MRGAPSVLVGACLAAALALGGCQASSPTGTSPATGPATAPINLAITVTGHDVVPPPATIKALPGQTVRLTLTTDRGGEIHVHAAEPALEAPVTPGTRTYTFDLVSQPGVYEVELHHPDLLLVSIAVQ